MGGRTSRRTTTYSAPAIKRNEVDTYKNTENGICLFNYKNKLSKYNLSSRQMKQIEIGLKCDYKSTKFNKFDFNILGNGRFTMYCYTFKIKKKVMAKGRLKLKQIDLNTMLQQLKNMNLEDGEFYIGLNRGNIIKVEHLLIVKLMIYKMK